MVMEGHPAVRKQRASLRLTDVVQQRGQPDHEIAVQAVPVLQPDGLIQHSERVLVDVLVPEVLIRFQAEFRDLREDHVRHTRVHEQRDPPPWAARLGRQHDLGEFILDPFG